MGIGRVSLTQENLAQGSFAEVERKVLFIGSPSANQNNDRLHSLNQLSDLDALLGSGDSPLKTHIEAARLNADENWVGFCYPIKEDADLPKSIQAAMLEPSDCDCESIALCNPIDSSESIQNAQAAAVSLQNSAAKFVTIHLSIRGLKEETWSEYLTFLKSLQAGLVADRVALVPEIYSGCLGTVMGRLAKHGVSIADSPMRIATGALVGVFEDVVDAEGQPLDMAIIQTLAESRYSVPQWYTGFDGLYWADHPLLDKEAGDFQVYEHRRILDYLARRVRILMLSKIANRELNSSPASISYHQSYFMKPLKEAAKGSSLNGRPIPGMIQPPEEGDILIQWKTRTTVDLYMQAAPLSCPKKINAKLSLDLDRMQ